MIAALLLPRLAFAADPAPAWSVDDAHGATHPVSLDVREGTWMSVAVSGDRVVFDLLGDLWSVPLTGGDATRLTSGAAWDAQPAFSPDGKRIAFTSDRGGNEQIWLMNADGSGARQVTSEADARVTEPTWDGDWLVVRRRTVDTRSIGVTELWQVHPDGGKGFRLTKLEEHPHAGEVTGGGRYLWFSSRAGRFEYDHDPLSSLWSIQRLDRKTGEILPQVVGTGSAARPELAPDGKHLVFVSRDRNKTLLEVVELATGERRVIADWLDRDEMEGFALHGVYPNMAWTASGELVLWAKGKLWRVKMDGTKTEIPFRAKGTWSFHDVERWAKKVPDDVTAKVLRWPAWSGDGSVAFSAMGQLWLRKPDGALEKLSEGTGYAPAWSPDGNRLAWTSWSDKDGGRLHVTTMAGKRKEEVLPQAGQYVNPAWSADGTRIVALRGVGGDASRDLGAEPWYEVVLLTREKEGWRSRVVTSVANRGSAARATRLFLRDDRVYFMEDRPAGDREPSNTVLVSVTLDGTDKRTHLVLAGAEEVAIAPDFRRVAYRVGHQAWVTAMPAWPGEVAMAEEPFPATRLSKVVGDWIAWTPDGKAVTWAEGPTLKRKVIEGLGAPPKDPAQKDPPKPDYDAGVEKVDVALKAPRAKPKGAFALTHVRVLTMKGTEVLEDATVVIRDDRILSINQPVPSDAEIIDGTGKTVIPGLVDVHAHLHYTAGDVLPEQEWRYLTSLDFGVTTVHDPSASTDLVFTQAERVEAGLEKGPRVYSTGMVLYGALSNEGAPTPDQEAARDHVRRMKALGAGSVKVYQQSQRERRQWYVQACYEERVQCIPEGGGDLFQNLAMVQDGFHAVEHSLPNAPLYADVQGWLAGSRTARSPGFAYTPTLLVAYGGLFGENWYYQHMTPLDDPRLLKHFPRRELDRVAWRRPTLAFDDPWNFLEVSRAAARFAKDGGLVTLGAHGQLQGLGAHWELWGLGASGAMPPMEALRAATWNGAVYLGLENEIGSIEPGKLADFVVLDANPLDDLHNTTRISFVVKNGEIFR